ncbi:MAG: hypothetical protein J7J91_07630 [Deltaproteobacteria bacterium]|nr:hypothetical protein [Deltaproteobacteria bacterium]
MKNEGKRRTLIDLEKLNTLIEGCPACGRKFNLGEEVVLARGQWEGFKYIHENEAVLDKKTNEHYERRYYASMKKSPVA